MECTAVKCDDEQKWEAEEEEALSLCDLPVNLTEEENLVQPRNEAAAGEDFNFGSWGGPLSTQPEMCSADELFFKGQILPLRLSVSSDSGLTWCRLDNQSTSLCLSRSGSMDHGSLNRFTSVSSSSRSSSTKSSHYSTSSSNSTTVTARNFDSINNSSSISNSTSNTVKIRNNFNSHPSPKPQIRSRTLPVNVSSRNQKSSKWDFFRLSLVRAPELELEDLKVRSNNNNANGNSVSRNSSCNSSNSSSSIKRSNSKDIVKNSGTEVAKNQLDLNKGFLEKRIGLFSGCKCSVNVVETVPLNNIVVIKSNNKNSEKEKAMSHAAMEEKKKLLQELKMRKIMKEREKEKQEGKQALSRHRTFEWLKELSHASYVDEA